MQELCSCLVLWCVWVVVNGLVPCNMLLDSGSNDMFFNFSLFTCHVCIVNSTKTVLFHSLTLVR